jgi:hypothetical protein
VRFAFRRRSISNDGPLALTLTLSLREMAPEPPLPEGEGGGEGELTAFTLPILQPGRPLGLSEGHVLNGCVVESNGLR